MYFLESLLKTVLFSYLVNQCNIRCDQPTGTRRSTCWQWRNQRFKPGGTNFAEGGPLATFWECNNYFAKTHIHYINMGLCLRLFAPHICGRKSSRTLGCGESHIQHGANREVATKDTRITQKWLFSAQYKAVLHHKYKQHRHVRSQKIFHG